ncbi:ParB N-terminal domain-containing protein [[Flexibacter] sp. ATCC 35208]|uniref:ParB N-terminal domain-containing protein n=1 Tax=[Flexibacter] sp. ATCC 35208 TaxID=1936242 RepID=UPI0009CE5129|nr:ParB N-terminal domain-containing protein [[Flexibacter] sp. ATCC 35208]OMP80031.1 hypothetical protein BW716_05940 [[Flexibacter] sp. ATCC 35208]
MTELIEEKVKELCALITALDGEDNKIDTLNLVRRHLHKISPLNHHPVDLVEWEKVENVRPNDYNPNHVAPPESKLLYLSILEDGYTMSIVGAREIEDDTRVIVDGFHRHQVVRDFKKISNSTFGRVPITNVREGKEGRADRIAATIRHNRARGVHAIDDMIEVVRILKVECGASNDWIVKHIGMDPDEVLRLSQLSGIAALFANKDFSKERDFDEATDQD